MGFMELVRKRYSVRAYKSVPIENEKLQIILEAMRLAPTAANLQPFKFIIYHTKGKEVELRRIYSADWFVEAPLVICACSIPSQSWIRGDGKNYAHIDTTIAMDYLVLAAADLGLGTCWVGAFDPQATREILKLPDDLEPIAFTPLGYPADQTEEKKRKPLNEIVCYEQWQES